MALEDQEDLRTWYDIRSVILRTSKLFQTSRNLFIKKYVILAKFTTRLKIFAVQRHWWALLENHGLTAHACISSFTEKHVQGYINVHFFTLDQDWRWSDIEGADIYLHFVWPHFREKETCVQWILITSSSIPWRTFLGQIWRFILEACWRLWHNR